MTLLGSVNIELLGPWLPALFDASVISLAAILAVAWMVKHSLITFRGAGGSEWVQLKVGAIVFTFEAIVMLALYLFPLPLLAWQETLFDTATLTLGTSLVIYGAVLKPVSQNERDDVDTVAKFNPTVVTNILGYLCFMILLFMILFSTYERQLQLRKVEVMNHEAKELKLVKIAFLNQLNDAALDTLILANQSNMLALLDGNRSLLNELQHDYRNIVQVKEHYEQLRFLDTEGNELIRIQRDGGRPVIMPHDELQSKGDYYYFKEGFSLFPGEIFISPLDLNVEHGEVERPYKPMIRLVTPLIDSKRQKKGVIVINLNGQQLLQAIEMAQETTIGKLMLLNEDGYFLFGAPSDLLWAFMFPGKSEERFERSYPDAWNKMEQSHDGTLLTPKGSFIVKEIEFTPDRITAAQTMEDDLKAHKRHWPVWKLVSHLPSSVVSEEMRGIRNLMILLYIFVLLLSAFATAILTRAMIKKRQVEQEVEHLAFHDSLTGLYNRGMFHEELLLEVAHARRQKNVLALMYMDLDHFKPVNDELGHDAGDAVLQEVAQRLRENLRDCDTIARIGGDEFAVILPRPGTKAEIAMIAERIIDKFKEAFHPLGQPRHLGISIGIGFLLDTDNTPDDLIHRTDHAMYDAKHAGRNRYHFAKE